MKSINNNNNDNNNNNNNNNKLSAYNKIFCKRITDNTKNTYGVKAIRSQQSMYEIIKWHVVVSATVNESLLLSRMLLDNQSGKETGQVKDQLGKSLKNVFPDPSSYVTHSFRLAGVMRAANSGICDRVFQRHGMSKSVAAKDGYIKDNVTKTLTFLLLPSSTKTKFALLTRPRQ